MKKRRLSTILSALIITLSMTSTVFAEDVGGSANGIVEAQTQQQIQNDRQKQELAKKYFNDKVKSNLKKSSNLPEAYFYGEGTRHILSFPAYAQETGYWCGPAAAYNAIKGRGITDPYLTQAQLASALNTTSAGTAFGTPWVVVMNGWLPDNNYSMALAGNYSDWNSTIRYDVVWTVDKGYAVIVDTRQDPSDSVRLTPNYSYVNNNTKSTYHYIAVTGYDLTSGRNDAYFSDSHPNFPGKYVTSFSTLGYLSRMFGVVW